MPDTLLSLKVAHTVQIFIWRISIKKIFQIDPTRINSRQTTTNLEQFHADNPIAKSSENIFQFRSIIRTITL